MDSSMESVGVGDGVPAPQAFNRNTRINPIAVNVP
jgi:hypothetical protein